jgi:hypothetical protein
MCEEKKLLSSWQLSPRGRRLHLNQHDCGKSHEPRHGALRELQEVEYDIALILMVLRWEL